MRLVRSIRGMVAVTRGSSNPVGDSEQRKGMRSFCSGRAHALLDVTAGDGAVGADVIRLVPGHQAKHGSADLHRILVVLGLDSPGPVVTRAALDGIESG